jgi:hypothetical protein
MWPVRGSGAVQDVKAIAKPLTSGKNNAFIGNAFGKITNKNNTL